jgi:hypothetical protein
MKTIVLFFLLFGMFFSCKNETDQFIPKNINPTFIAEGILLSNFSKSSGTKNFVINSELEWDSFITSMDNPNGLSESFNEVTIDFDLFTVLAVFDQPRSTGGYTVTIKKIIENVDNIVVNVEYSGEADASQMPTHPYYIVKIPKVKKQVIFK